MAMELRRDPATRSGAIRRAAEQLGMHPETLRNWVRQAEIDERARPGTSTGDTERIKQLEAEVRSGAAPLNSSCSRPLTTSSANAQAYDGFENDPNFGPPGMASLGFQDWFKPFNTEIGGYHRSWRTATDPPPTSGTGVRTICELEP
jgi:hypothetical protein